MGELDEEYYKKDEQKTDNTDWDTKESVWKTENVKTEEMEVASDWPVADEGAENNDINWVANENKGEDKPTQYME